ncbi:MIF4G domain-containing protein [Struthio camelus australis]|uniref:MIF4G domain-containing protein n=1 Tax=Struthio camelus australis TaxID=441894 RepID=A0A093H1T7_STRCA|nr:MIF4G domain-containing protein [Struthio camelus australis]
MGETGKEEYKIQSFDAETQQLLKTALKGAARSWAALQVPRSEQREGCWVLTVLPPSADPSSVDLEKVANIIVDQSLQDCVFSKEAGRICYTIIQVRESLLSGQRNAGSVLRQPLARPRRGFSQPRAVSPGAGFSSAPAPEGLLPFLNNMPRMGLVNPVYDCLFRLAQPDSLRKEEEVDCLVLQLHRIGEQLEKMNSQRMDELFSLLRDGFLLQDGLSSLSQLLLLEIIEFRAADWKMTDAAQKYYYSEVTD